MLTAFGVGEVAISVSSDPGSVGPLEHTIRDVGAVTQRSATECHRHRRRGPRAVRQRDGASTKVRGRRRRCRGRRWDRPRPAAGRSSRTSWSARPSGEAAVRARRRPRHRTQIIFETSSQSWRARRRRGRGHRRRRADRAGGATVGLVTSLLPTAPFDPAQTVALICGPEIMMRFTAASARRPRRRPASIRVSLERNMQCGVGLCGHCQLGPLLLCRDGPIVAYAGVVPTAHGSASDDRRPEPNGPPPSRTSDRRWRCGSSPRATAAS